MPTKTPTQSDFPSHLTVTLTPPPPSSSASLTSRPPPNILILLHGLGDSAPAFTSFARALNLPETLIVTLQAPNRLPLDLPGFHWGDDISFDTSTGGLDMDAGFAGATNVLVNEVLRDTLLRKCGYRAREILLLGFGQGGMLGLLGVREFAKTQQGQGDGDGSALAGVIVIGAPYPLSGSTVGEKNRTPVLLVAGRESAAVTDGAVRRTKQVFEFVEVQRYARRDDGMPRNRDEMMPVMQFFARRLRSWQGVPEGSVEIS
ncbi:Phospholipase/Carboxylesterase superfamily [Aspergillus affinis]|uniref:Phospholipase/Carboxylesterase superfamily n=1 Tax=Aspergillus affinis TaxID=1070780 RepID=UPI0022FE1B0A|nr:Phospholipase/Carboxylesterase superfamily [Aspergillus affinis]KAI9045369.1 Phospholipase/Carboxylesterase superfamily [Aspergillus affinis]